MAGSTRMTRPIGIISSVRLDRMTNMTSINRQTTLPKVIRQGIQTRIAGLLRLTITGNMDMRDRLNSMVKLDRTITMERLTWRDRHAILYRLTRMSRMAIFPILASMGSMPRKPRLTRTVSRASLRRLIRFHGGFRPPLTLTIDRLY